MSINQIKNKHIIEARIVKTTTIANGIQTTNTRLQTPEEKLASLRNALEAIGAQIEMVIA